MTSLEMDWGLAKGQATEGCSQWQGLWMGQCHIWCAAGQHSRPILFTIFINDLDEEVVEKVKVLLKFADDTKIGNIVDNDESWKSLQDALDCLCTWAANWERKFNVDKCHVLHLGRNNKRRPYVMHGKQLETSEIQEQPESSETQEQLE